MTAYTWAHNLKKYVLIVLFPFVEALTEEEKEKLAKIKKKMKRKVCSSDCL